MKTIANHLDYIIIEFYTNGLSSLTEEQHLMTFEFKTDSDSDSNKSGFIDDGLSELTGLAAEKIL